MGSKKITVRILDRYLARSFLVPLLLALAIIVGLVTVAHAFGKIDDYMRAANTISQALSRMGRIYLLQIPIFISYVLPIAMLIGAAHGISQLSGKNEFTAMSACGISLWRILAPVYALATIIAFLGMANRELLIPRLEQIAASDMQRWIGKEDDFRSVIISKPEESTAFTLSYNLATHKARAFTITCRDTGEHFSATTAEYTDGAWLLKNVRHGEEQIPEMTWATTLTPREIELMMMEPRLAPLNILKQLIRQNPENPQYVLLFHDRLSYPFSAIVLVAIGLPFVVGNERIRRNRMLGIGLCLLICGIFYTVWFIASDLGQNGYLPPQIAAWLPTIIFGALALYLLEAVHS